MQMQNDDENEKVEGGIKTLSSQQSNSKGTGKGERESKAAECLRAAWDEAVFLLTTREGLIGEYEYVHPLYISGRV